jgi:hypothetical protein
MHVHKPFLSPLIGKWQVLITETTSPASRQIEVARFQSREDAYQFYRQAMKELGRGL